MNKSKKMINFLWEQIFYKDLYQITCGNGIGEGVLLHSIPIFPGKRNTNSAQVLLCKKWKLKKEES